ncbi:MAG TPA: CAP domain-containing protein [Sphingomicrobium sp.]|nr:CAP domain-containing protein [Sphingomicrobium sp.]
MRSDFAGRSVIALALLTTATSAGAQATRQSAQQSPPAEDILNDIDPPPPPTTENILNDIDPPPPPPAEDILRDIAPGPPAEDILNDIAPARPVEDILKDIETPLTPQTAPSETQTMAVEPTRFDYPPTDMDLEEVAKRAAAYLAAANCKGMTCPKTDCAKARDALQALSDMEQYLQAQLEALEHADADYRTQLEAVAGENLRTGRATAALQDNLALQKFFHDLGSAMLDIASIASFGKDIAEKSLSDLSRGELLQRLDGLYESIKDVESGASTLASSLAGHDVPTPVADLANKFGDADTVNDAKSHVSDAVSVIKSAAENGKDWRKALQESGKWDALKEAAKSGAIADLGQIAGRFLKSWSSGKLKEQQERLDELLRAADAGDILQAQSYINLQRAQQRRWAAFDALAQVRAAKQAYADCIAKACGLVTLTRPRIPSFQQSGGGRALYSWGAALRWLNGAIAATLPRMTPVPFTDDCRKTSQAQTSTTPELDKFARLFLDVHNAERSTVGAAPLQWDPQLAANAAIYAGELARTGRLQHAPREGRGIERENLSQGLLGWNQRQMMQNWVKEKRYFIPGLFPDVSRTGNWADVAHYTQMIWPTTIKVGCGMASGSGFKWLVCRYSPGGNKDGKPVLIQQPTAEAKRGN